MENTNDVSLGAVDEAIAQTLQRSNAECLFFIDLSPIWAQKECYPNLPYGLVLGGGSLEG